MTVNETRPVVHIERHGEWQRVGRLTGFTTHPEPDPADACNDTRTALTGATPGPLLERVRQIADDLDPGPGTHSPACWQWHDACALHRLIERTQP